MTALQKQKRNGEKYASDIMRYYKNHVLTKSDVDSLGNISMSAEREIRQIFKSGKLTGCCL